MQSGFIKQYHSFFHPYTRTRRCGPYWAVFMAGFAHLAAKSGHITITLLLCRFPCAFYLIARYRGLYQSWRSQTFTQEAIVVIRTFMATLFILLMVAFALKSTEVYSRMVMVSWLLLCPLWLLSFRLLVRFYLRMKRASGRNTRTVAIAGADSLASCFGGFHRAKPLDGYSCFGLL